jgi:GntP family gluconate:H+ symporter
VIDPHSLILLIAALVSVLALIFLVAVGKLNPFITLMLVSLGLGVVAGMSATDVVKSFEKGMGGTLGHIAIVVGLGTMLGKMMAESGGADRVATTLIDIFGEKNIQWAMVTIGLIVGLPAFFEVGFVLLIPIAYTAARRTKKPFLLIGLPMVAGLSVDHALVPPHPAALLAALIYHANVGTTIFYALLIGIPTAILAGPLYAMWLVKRLKTSTDNPMADQLTERDPGHALPSFGVTMGTILLPVVLMLLGSLGGTAFAHASGAWGKVGGFLRFIGDDDIALLIGAIVSFFTLGIWRGYSREAILKFSNQCLAPTAAITLLVGAGGGFGRVLIDSGVAKALIALALGIHLPLLIFAWGLAVMMRLATGSATVSMTTAAGIVAPIALHAHYPHPALLAIATGAGSVFFSHVNDGGFWLVKEYFNMTVPETLKSWSVCETIISVAGLLFCLGLAHII